MLLPTLQPPPAEQLDAYQPSTINYQLPWPLELKVDDDDGMGGDDAADCLRYLVSTKARTITQQKLRGF